MKKDELDELNLIFEIGQLVIFTAKSIIKDENLLRSEGQFMFDGHKFDIIVKEVADDTEV